MIRCPGIEISATLVIRVVLGAIPSRTEFLLTQRFAVKVTRSTGGSSSRARQVDRVFVTAAARGSFAASLVEDDTWKSKTLHYPIMIEADLNVAKACVSRIPLPVEEELCVTKS